MYHTCTVSRPSIESPVVSGVLSLLSHRPRLPSFHELTERLTDEEDGLKSPVQLPLPRLSTTPPPQARHSFSLTQHGAPSRLASFLEVDTKPDHSQQPTVIVAAPPNTPYDCNHPAGLRLPTHGRQLGLPSLTTDVPMNLQVNINYDYGLQPHDDETLVPHSYRDALRGIATASSNLYDFGERFNAQCRVEHAGLHGRATTFASLPSSRMVQMMIMSANAVKRKLKEVQDLVERAQMDAREASGLLSPVEGERIEGRGRGYGSQKGREEIDENGKGEGKLRRGKRKGTAVKEGKVKKSLPARNPAGKCYTCGSVESTEWRRGPNGVRTLCNPCGIRYAKMAGQSSLPSSISPDPEALIPVSGS